MAEHEERDRFLRCLRRRHTRGIQHQERREAEPQKVIPAWRGHLFGGQEAADTEEQQGQRDEQRQPGTTRRRPDLIVHIAEETHHVMRLDAGGSIRGGGPWDRELFGDVLAVDLGCDRAEVAAQRDVRVAPGGCLRVVAHEQAARRGIRLRGLHARLAGESRLESAGEIVVAAQRADLHAHPTGDRMHRAEVGGLHGHR